MKFDTFIPKKVEFKSGKFKSSSFRKFKSGDLSVEGKERAGQPKKFDDEELEELIGQDQCQTLQELSESLKVDKSTVSRRFHSIGVVQKLGNWVPHELTERAVPNRLTISEILLQRQKRKGFLQRINTGDEKWKYYDNLKRLKAWVKQNKPGH